MGRIRPWNRANKAARESGWARTTDSAVEMVEVAGVELHSVFCLCNLQILKGPQNKKIDNSQGHRTVIVQSHERSNAKPSRPTSCTCGSRAPGRAAPATVGQDLSGVNAQLAPRHTGKTSTVRRIFPNHQFVSLALPMEAGQTEKEPNGFLHRTRTGDQRNAKRARAIPPPQKRCPCPADQSWAIPCSPAPQNSP